MDHRQIECASACDTPSSEWLHFVSDPIPFTELDSITHLYPSNVIPVLRKPDIFSRTMTFQCCQFSHFLMQLRFARRTMVYSRYMKRVELWVFSLCSTIPLSAAVMPSSCILSGAASQRKSPKGTRSGSFETQWRDRMMESRSRVPEKFRAWDAKVESADAVMNKSRI